MQKLKYPELVRTLANGFFILSIGRMQINIKLLRNDLLIRVKNHTNIHLFDLHFLPVKFYPKKMIRLLTKKKGKDIFYSITSIEERLNHQKYIIGP